MDCLGEECGWARKRDVSEKCVKFVVCANWEFTYDLVYDNMKCNQL